MLRTRLLLGLLTLVLLLWAVGGAGFMIVKDAGSRFDQRLTIDYQAINLAQKFRSGTSLLNTHYLTSLAAPPEEKAIDRGLYQETIASFSENLALLKNLSGGNERWLELLDTLEEAIGVYQSGYADVLSNQVVDPKDRSELLVEVGSHTQRITDVSNSLATLAEERLFASSDSLVKESGKNLLFIGTLVVLGTGIAVLIYFQLLRHLVEPVIGLKQSFEEVKKGNFEFTLPMPDRGSEFSALVSSLNEMSSELRLRRRETDQRLMRKNLLNRALLSAIPSPVYVIADDGSTPILNPAAEQLSERLKIGKQLPSKARRLFDDCVETQQNLLPEDPREALLFRIDDEEIYFLPRIFRFSSEVEQYSGWAVLLQDVTRIRWLDDMKTNLIATVSHEIKTPLTGIRMVLLLLLEAESRDLSDIQREMLASASGDCERLLETLNNLLDLSRAESGTTQLKLAPMTLTDSAEESARLFEQTAATRGMEIKVEHNGSVPDVMADSVRLREVINNLVSNAIKHGPANSVITLRIARNGGDFLRLSVLDDGPGVPVESQNRIFERFFRAEGQESDGVGLGLFICREIMRAHDGRIGLSEKLNDQPTEFYIDVPIA